MTAKKIKVCFLNLDIKNVSDMTKRLRIEGLPFTKNFVWDDEEPDYIFATDHIYYISTYAEKFMKLAQRPAIRIFTLGECIAPDLNIFDYAIVFDKKLSDMDRVSSMPSSLLSNEAVTKTENDLNETEAKSLLKNRKRFCSFIYSNAGAHPNRDKLFHALSSYKHVDSLGKHLNNVNTLITQRGGGMIGAGLV